MPSKEYSQSHLLKKEKFLTEHWLCPTCEEWLEFKAKCDDHGEVTEEAHCPKCQSVSRIETHTLH